MNTITNVKNSIIRLWNPCPLTIQKHKQLLSEKDVMETINNLNNRLESIKSMGKKTNEEYDNLRKKIQETTINLSMNENISKSEIVDIIDNIIIVTDPEGNILSYNDAFLKYIIKNDSCKNDNIEQVLDFNNFIQTEVQEFKGIKYNKRGYYCDLNNNICYQCSTVLSTNGSELPYAIVRVFTKLNEPETDDHQYNMFDYIKNLLYKNIQTNVRSTKHVV
jgi:hypothetical protein